MNVLGVARLAIHGIVWVFVMSVGQRGINSKAFGVSVGVLNSDVSPIAPLCGRVDHALHTRIRTNECLWKK